MHPAPIIGGDQHADRRLMMIHLLRVTAGTPRMPAELGPQRQIEPLNMIGRHLGIIRVPALDIVPPTHPFVLHHIVDVAPEGFGDRILVGAKGIGGDLRPVDDPSPDVGHKRIGILCGPFPHQIGDDRFGVGLKRQPEIGIPVLLRVAVLEILLLLADEWPSLVELHTGDLEPAHPGMVEAMAGSPGPNLLWLGEREAETI